MMRYVFLLLFVVIAPTAWAQSHGQLMPQCFSKDPKTSIAGCTAIINSGINVRPIKYLAYLFRGFGELNSQQPDQAIKDETIATSIDPKSSSPHLILGEAYGEKFLWNSDILEETNAIALLRPNPENHDSVIAYSERGFAELHSNLLLPAIADTSAAIKLDPNDPHPYFNRAIAYEKLGRYNDSIADDTKYLELKPTSAAGHVNRSIDYVKLHNYPAAQADDDEAVQINPKDKNAWNEDCWVNAILGHLQPAMQECEKALELDPNDPNAIDSLAFVYLKMKAFSLAIAKYTNSLSLKSSSTPRVQASSLYGRALAEQALGQTQAATADFTAAKTIDPNIAKNFGT